MRNALSELLADRRVILRRPQDGIVFIHGKALVGHRLLQSVVCLVGNALFVGRRGLGDFAFIALLVLVTSPRAAAAAVSFSSGMVGEGDCSSGDCA
jgi:hypothetical protein